MNRTKEDDIQANGKESMFPNFKDVRLIIPLWESKLVSLELCRGLFKRKEITTDFIEVAGTTRINVFTKVTQDQKEYKLVNKDQNYLKNMYNVFKISELRKGIICAYQEVYHKGFAKYFD